MRTTIIYVVGVISVSLFHSVTQPCLALIGPDGGISALIGKTACDFISFNNIPKFAHPIIPLILNQVLG